MKPRRPTTLYPLGKNIFASVKTRKGEVKIQIRHYAVATNIKGGRAVPTQKGVSLGLKEFQRLLKIQKNLAQDYNQQMSSLFILQETVTDPWPQRGRRKRTDTESHTVNRRGRKKNCSSCRSPIVDPTATVDPATLCVTGNYLQQIRQPSPAFCPATTSNLPVQRYSGNDENRSGQ